MRLPKFLFIIGFLTVLGFASLMANHPAMAATFQVTVTIENLAPVHGNYLTPFWVGFHDGSFDIYDPGSPGSDALESLAEDGDAGPIAGAFTTSGAGLVNGTILGPGGPIAPGKIASMDFTLDGSIATSRYFSYAAMVIPSNDAFVANGDPSAFQVFSDTGTFLGADFFITGAQVRDAGTEVNDELPPNTAFFGQMTPNTGVDENRVVQVHPGFNPPGSGGILDDAVFENADFKREGYPVAQIRVTAIPLPATVLLLGSGLVGLLGLRRKFGKK
jgi:hypothetical protein